MSTRTSKINLANYYRSIRKDVDNELNLRNTRNSPIEHYNCGGYALSTYTWVCPFISHVSGQYNYMSKGHFHDVSYNETSRVQLIMKLSSEGKSWGEIEEEILQRDVEFLLKRYPFLRQVDIDGVDKEVPLIAYRIFVGESYSEAFDTDFHFKKRVHGRWSEKMGSHKILDCELDADRPWSYSDGYTVYTSRIVYFTNSRYCSADFGGTKNDEKQNLCGEG